MQKLVIADQKNIWLNVWRSDGRQLENNWSTTHIDKFQDTCTRKNPISKTLGSAERNARSTAVV
jgi:hypothetical protein